MKCMICNENGKVDYMYVCSSCREEIKDKDVLELWFE